MITEFDLPGDNPRVAVVGTPIKYTSTLSGFYRRAPRLGEHSAEIRQEFNLPEQQDE
jgi:crotonobetainyl-CoA:carnitine CoA-transferase CaiB-like acyl-CoA transferase